MLINTLHIGFLALFLLGFAWQQPVTIAVSYLLAGVYSFTCWGGAKISQDAIMVGSCFMLILMFSVLNFNFGGTSLFYLVLSPLLVLAAYKLTDRSINQLFDILGGLYWSIVAFVFLVVVFNWDIPDPFEGLIPGTSTNGIPAYVIVLQISFSLIYFYKNKRLPILPCVATIAVAVFGLGRSSMIVSTLIFLASVFFNVIASKVDRKIIFRYCSIPAVLLIVYAFTISDEIFLVVDNLIEASKFSAGVRDEHREMQIHDYLGKIDGWTLFFGSDFSRTSITEHYGGNPHNSYIRLHSFYGLAGFLLVIIPLVYIVSSRREFIIKAVTFVFVLFALLRAGSEPIFFPTPLDLFYWLYLFMFYKFGGAHAK